MKKSLFISVVAALFAVTIFTASAFADCWVAIALNQSKRTYAIAKGDTLWGTQKDAMQKSGMPGAAIWLWAHEKFIVMAVDESNPGIFGMAHGITLEEATRDAISICQKSGGQRCNVVAKDGCGSQQPQPIGPSPAPNPIPDDHRFKW